MASEQNSKDGKKKSSCNNSTQSKDFNVDVRMDEAVKKRIEDLKHLKTMKSHYSLASFVIAFDFYCEFRNVNARRNLL